MAETQISTNTSTQQAWIAKRRKPPERSCQPRSRMRQLHTFGSVGGEARQRPLLPGHGRKILIPPQGSSWLLASSPPVPRFDSPTLCRPNIEFAWAAHDQGGVTIWA